jgi:hypothetical protein
MEKQFLTMALRKKSEKREKMKKRWRREGGRGMMSKTMMIG